MTWRRDERQNIPPKETMASDGPDRQEMKLFHNQLEKEIPVLDPKIVSENIREIHSFYTKAISPKAAFEKLCSLHQNILMLYIRETLSNVKKLPFGCKRVSQKIINFCPDRIMGGPPLPPSLTLNIGSLVKQTRPRWNSEMDLFPTPRRMASHLDGGDEDVSGANLHEATCATEDRPAREQYGYKQQLFISV